MKKYKIKDEFLSKWGIMGQSPHITRSDVDLIIEKPTKFAPRKTYQVPAAHGNAHAWFRSY